MWRFLESPPRLQSYLNAEFQICCQYTRGTGVIFHDWIRTSRNTPGLLWIFSITTGLNKYNTLWTTWTFSHGNPSRISVCNRWMMCLVYQYETASCSRPVEAGTPAALDIHRRERGGEADLEQKTRRHRDPKFLGQ